MAEGRLFCIHTYVSMVCFCVVLIFRTCCNFTSNSKPQAYEFTTADCCNFDDDCWRRTPGAGLLPSSARSWRALHPLHHLWWATTTGTTSPSITWRIGSRILAWFCVPCKGSTAPSWPSHCTISTISNGFWWFYVDGEGPAIMLWA